LREGDPKNTYYRSLVATLDFMEPLDLLRPDPKCYQSARCHAYRSGITGYVGHERGGNCRKNEYYNGECCDYGNSKALDIVMSLLVDDGVPSLGHRQICLGEYSSIGVSIQPHKAWNYNTVLDFHF
jgi:uncharacterized protein YkwD